MIKELALAGGGEGVSHLVVAGLVAQDGDDDGVMQVGRVQELLLGVHLGLS